ncbi:hypothetical protein [Oribacterium sp. WCC10]|uniref:hypothetical protein n=1 Tax=Oribacterium sp. WCC10 TaxID=1855343 RepID=UPI0008F161D1|nr:hypothetical protein [Oribacterium sp. WCC10]SFG16534.1 hypothetical protein SAMN05216356_102259 [Oribacterium sp. WCC10]
MNIEKIRAFLNRNRNIFIIVTFILIATLIYRYTDNFYINLVICVIAVYSYLHFFNTKWKNKK